MTVFNCKDGSGKDQEEEKRMFVLEGEYGGSMVGSTRLFTSSKCQVNINSCTGGGAVVLVLGCGPNIDEMR